jgi:hypothetical protein
MATVVMHKESETNYLLVGTGYGMWATDKPGFMGLGDFKDGYVSVVFVCDASGTIGRFPADELVVVSVDGVPVVEHFNSPPPPSGLPS